MQFINHHFMFLDRIINRNEKELVSQNDRKKKQIPLQNRQDCVCF